MSNTPKHEGVNMAIAAAREHDEKPDINLTVHLDEHEYTVVIAALQLAMRHDGFKRMPSFNVVRRFTDKLIFMCPEDRPCLRALLAMGDEPQYDR